MFCILVCGTTVAVLAPPSRGASTEAKSLPRFYPILLNSQNKVAARMIDAGRVNIQASARFRTVDICSPE